MNIVYFAKEMVQINKREELTKLVSDYKNVAVSEFPELSSDTPQNAGKLFELFICREIYGPKLGISSNDELDASMDFNSSGEGPIDIAFLPGDNDLHIFEAKWLSRSSASFKKDWTSSGNPRKVFSVFGKNFEEYPLQVASRPRELASVIL